MKRTLIALAASIALPALALAQSGHGSHTGHGGHHGRAMDHGQHSANVPADASASSAAFRAANARMHEAMDIELTGDADRDFVAGMIPHHQGAIDMARIVLEHGEDAQVRALAKEVIAAQEKEIAWMREWLENNR